MAYKSLIMAGAKAYNQYNNGINLTETENNLEENLQLKQASPMPVRDRTTMNDHRFGMKLAASVAHDQKKIPPTKIHLRAIQWH